MAVVSSRDLPLRVDASGGAAGGQIGRSEDLAEQGGAVAGHQSSVQA
jgi:hypothetical protein